MNLIKVTIDRNICMAITIGASLPAFCASTLNATTPIENPRVLIKTKDILELFPIQFQTLRIHEPWPPNRRLKSRLYSPHHDPAGTGGNIE